jgi:cytosine/adenosine deaminase-related metal-dependent hydrolase
LHVALAPSAPQRCTDDFVLAIDDLSKRSNVPWNTHVLETKVQAVTGPEFYDKSIVEHLAELGVLTPRLALIHGVWLKERDMELLAGSETSVVHNPVSNLKVGSGIAPIRDMLKAGVNVALGCDNSGAVDTQNMFETMKFAALLPEVEGPEFAVWEPARQVLRMATIHGAKSVLLEDSIGSLEVGKRADIVLYDLETQPFTPLNDPERQLVYSETGQSVDTVLVDGNVVVENGQLLTMDEEAVLREAEEIGQAFGQEDEKAKQFADELRPYLESMYWHAVKQDVGINRYSRAFAKQDAG